MSETSSFPCEYRQRDTPTQFFPCEYCEKIYVEEYLQITASIFQKCFMLIESVATVSVLSHMLINLFLLLFHDGGPYHIETSPLIFRASQWAGFYVIGTSVMEELKAM